MTENHLYHLVCRECRTEALDESESNLEAEATRHSTERDHRVAVRRIQ